MHHFLGGVVTFKWVLECVSSLGNGELWDLLPGRAGLGVWGLLKECHSNR